MSTSAVYILASKPYGTLYIGVTSNLIRRIYEHKNDINKGFTQKYQVHSLVYYELFNDIGAAILREKKMKAANRKRKLYFIRTMNPGWIDLYQGLL